MQEDYSGCTSSVVYACAMLITFWDTSALGTADKSSHLSYVEHTVSEDTVDRGDVCVRVRVGVCVCILPSIENVVSSG